MSGSELRFQANVTLEAAVKRVAKANTTKNRVTVRTCFRKRPKKYIAHLSFLLFRLNEQTRKQFCPARPPFSDAHSDTSMSATCCCSARNGWEGLYRPLDQGCKNVQWYNIRGWVYAKGKRQVEEKKATGCETRRFKERGEELSSER